IEADHARQRTARPAVDQGEGDVHDADLFVIGGGQPVEQTVVLTRMDRAGGGDLGAHFAPFAGVAAGAAAGVAGAGWARCACSHCSNSLRGSTCTSISISAWLAPHSCVHWPL